MNILLILLVAFAFLLWFYSAGVFGSKFFFPRQKKRRKDFDRLRFETIKQHPNVYLSPKKLAEILGISQRRYNKLLLEPDYEFIPFCILFITLIGGLVFSVHHQTIYLVLLLLVTTIRLFFWVRLKSMPSGIDSFITKKVNQSCLFFVGALITTLLAGYVKTFFILLLGLSIFIAGGFLWVYLDDKLNELRG
ncbi:hypothetical protein [Paenibacillus sp. Soil522]|uniref:hypothetical protein n=1 Tax=Paenibacillus sp. Soil522 TaxID=1736388 RepID=UPI0006FEB640|nr:hypothetical protein [Paenibacillus sp. Soil522]KRE45503.1 hypothetical protein ASG81_12885 [Paenibacillus sp. Soil522]